MLFRFGTQKAFESACLLGELTLIKEMVSSSQKYSLFVSHDLLRELIRLKQTKVLQTLLNECGRLELRGENIDPNGICGTILKQD